MVRLKPIAARAACVVAILSTSVAFASGDESPRIAALRAASPEAREAIVAEFWRSVEATGTPLVEQVAADGGAVRVTFLWRAQPGEAESNIGLIGSFVPGGSRELVHFERITETDVLAKSFTVDASARYRYYLAWPEGRQRDAQAISRLELNGLAYELFADPRAAQTFPDDGDGEPVATSYFEGPRAPAEPWLAEPSSAPRGNLETIDFESRALGNTRKISIYVPAGYRPRGPGYPFVLLFDREPYLRSAPTVRILDYLIAQGSVPPTVAILVSPIDEAHRGEELRPNARFESFIVDELMPAMRKRLSLSRDPRRAVIAGSSLGGLASASIARSHPNVFGNVLSMSGSYWWFPKVDESNGDASAEEGSGWLPRKYAASPRLPLRFYVCVGLGEGQGMLAPNRLFRDVLTAAGYPLRYEEFHGDHSYLNWRDSLASGLRFLARAH